MSYLPDAMPVPMPGPDDAPFWAAWRRRELRIQRCSDCATFRHPPGLVCAACRSPSHECAGAQNRHGVQLHHSRPPDAPCAARPGSLQHRRRAAESGRGRAPGKQHHERRKRGPRHRHARAAALGHVGGRAEQQARGFEHGLRHVHARLISSMALENDPRSGRVGVAGSPPLR